MSQGITYNQCGHNLLGYKLGYLAWHIEADKRRKKKMKQKECPICKLFLFKDELPPPPF